MKTGRIATETVSIWCPECNQFVPDPDTGSSLIDPEGYSKLPQVITCEDCGERFRKPKAKSFTD